MKAPFIFMNTDSEYFYIFPDVFFSKSGGAFIVNRKNKKCLTRLFLDRLTPAKLFYYINYAMS